MKKYIRRSVIGILLAVCMLCSTAYALPPAIREGKLVTAQTQFETAEQLAYYVRKLHIYSGLNDNPLLRTYQAVMETDEALTPNQLRWAIIRYFGKDAANCEKFLDSMLDLYDPYTNLMTPEEYDAAYPKNSDFKGIGFTFRAYGPFLLITNVYEDSPAGRAGILEGDLIATIAGQDIRTLTDEKRTALMESTRGKEFRVGLYREGEDALIKLTIMPGKVVVPYIEYRILDDGVGYLSINRFDGDTFAADLAGAVEAFKTAGITDLIIDVRSNPGGSVGQLLTAVNAFVPEKGKIIFSEQKRDSKFAHYTTGGGYDPGEIYILMSGNSASSSEIFAGSLRDMGYATLVGTKSFGKGCGQAGYYFGNEILVITSTQAILPVTGAYNGIGLTPDIEVENAKISVDVDGLAAFTSAKTVTKKSDAADIMALEQRLKLTGYLFADADGIWDDATTKAIADVYRALNRSVSDGADTVLLDALGVMVERLRSAYRDTDAALEKILVLLAERDAPAA